MPTYFTAQGSRLEIPESNKIGTGATGVVYGIPSQNKQVAKIYMDNKTQDVRRIRGRELEKLESMTRIQSSELQRFTSWPLDVLYASEAGTEAVGFLMKKIEGHYPIYNAFDPQDRLPTFPTYTWSHLIRMASNLARSFAAIHQTKQLVIGDISSKNIFVAPDCTVQLIDCDSFQINVHGKIFRCLENTREYTPPELQGQNNSQYDRTENHDLFGLAVLIFQLLFMGKYPFSGVPTAQDISIESAIKGFHFAFSSSSTLLRQPPLSLSLSSTPEEIRDFFEQAFGRNGVQRRPTAQEWIIALDDFAAKLKPCSVNGSHYYYENTCPWCALEMPPQLIFFNPTAPKNTFKNIPNNTPPVSSPQPQPISSSTSRAKSPVVAQAAPSKPIGRWIIMLLLVVGIGWYFLPNIKRYFASTEVVNNGLSLSSSEQRYDGKIGNIRATINISQQNNEITGTIKYKNEPIPLRGRVEGQEFTIQEMTENAGTFSGRFAGSTDILTGIWKKNNGSKSMAFYFVKSKDQNQISQSPTRETTTQLAENSPESSRRETPPTNDNLQHLPGRYPEASERELARDELTDFNTEELRLIRNEIYARHGYINKTPELYDYFTKQPWYKPIYNDELFVYNSFTEIEKKNVELIKEIEKLKK